MHAKATALGGRDEGAGAAREGEHAAYFRDLDGNKLCIYTIVEGWHHVPPAPVRRQGSCGGS